jgi:hypothetical protein
VFQNADGGNPPRRLRLDNERRGDRTGQRGQQEAAAVHAGTVGRMRAKVNRRGAPYELEGSLGSIGGKIGGKARMSKLTTEQRRALAKKAAAARWSETRKG